MAYIMIVEGGKHRMVRQVGYREEKGEATLQDLVEKHPDLLPLPGVESGDLAILTVHREFKATDLLCVDSGGGITIVECKLSDNQTMREIVAQLLGYASILWKSTYSELNQRVSEYLKQDVAEAMLHACREKGIVGEDEDEEEWKEDFRIKLINTLETGDFNLAIVADEVPHDIRGVADYLSSLYSMQVYPVEIRYFPSDKDLEVMVPHLIEFGKRSSTPPSTQRAARDKQSFLKVCEQEVKAVAESIIGFLETLELEGRGFIEYGGSVVGTAKFYAPNRKRIFSLYSNGEIWMILRPEIGVAEAVLQEYISKLNEISIFRYSPKKDIGERKSQAGVDSLRAGEIDRFHETITWILSKVGEGVPDRGKDSVGD